MTCMSPTHHTCSMSCIAWTLERKVWGGREGDEQSGSICTCDVHGHLGGEVKMANNNREQRGWSRHPTVMPCRFYMPSGS